MKKVLLSLAVLFASIQAHAAPFLPSLLEYQEVPAAFDSLEPLKKLTVYANGKVVAYKGTVLVSVQTLSNTDMDRVYSLVQEAKDGQLVRQPVEMYCFMASPVTYHYTTGLVGEALYKGHPCNGNVFKNNSPATDALIELLNDLKTKAFARD